MCSMNTYVVKYTAPASTDVLTETVQADTFTYDENRHQALFYSEMQLVGLYGNVVAVTKVT